MRVSAVARQREDTRRLTPQDRNMGHRLRVRRGPQQAKEPVLSNDGAMLVTNPYPDVIAVTIALYCRAHRILGDDNGRLIVIMRNGVKSRPLLSDAKMSTCDRSHRLAINREFLVGEVHEVIISQPLK